MSTPGYRLTPTSASTGEPHVIVVGYRDEDGTWHYAHGEPMPYDDAVQACRRFKAPEGQVAFARPQGWKVGDR
jgi:hypothetical protein